MMTQPGRDPLRARPCSTRCTRCSFPSVAARVAARPGSLRAALASAIRTDGHRTGRLTLTRCSKKEVIKCTHCDFRAFHARRDHYCLAKKTALWPLRLAQRIFLCGPPLSWCEAHGSPRTVPPG
eukprot:5607866-Prymnesium_polylepis.1